MSEPTQPVEKDQQTQNLPSQSNQPTQPLNEEANIEKLIEEMNLEEPIEQEPKQQNNEEDENIKSSQNEVIDETKCFVEISRTNIAFGKTVLFPGSIEELDVSIGLKQQILQDNANPLMLRVIAKCNNVEFDALDEYVFSVRSNERFQYFEEVRFKIRKKQKALVKVAVKIPSVKQNYTIDGILEIQLESLAPVYLPISAKCQIPELICLKDLYKEDEGCTMIKVPAKKNQIRMPPIPFKNLSNFNFTLEIEAITNENFSSRPYDIITQNFVSCQANTQFFVNLQLKQNMNYKGIMPIKDTIRKVLILKIKNSSVFFNFPLEVQVIEGANSGGMS